MRPHSRFNVSRTNPEARGVCDRCGSHWQRSVLQFQFQWVGPTLRSLGSLVCPRCLDIPQEQLRTILIPPDPEPIRNPRTENYTADDAPISGLGTNIGTMSQWGGLNAAFDSTVNKPSAFCAALGTSVAGYSNWVGKQWSADSQPITADASSQTVTVTRFKLYAPNDTPFLTSGAVAYRLQGSDDGSTWTTLYSGTTDGDDGESIDVDSGITSTDYQYHRLVFNGDGVSTIAIAQFVIYGTGLSA